LEWVKRIKIGTQHNPQINGKTERVNQVIEDMLRMYVTDKPPKWEDYLRLVEFSYNNGYQASLRMSPFEALYGKSTIVQLVGKIEQTM
jgi:hypothetical protein